MKAFATIALSLIAAVASLCLVFSGICAVSGGLSGGQRGFYLAWAIFFLAILVACMAAIGGINRKPPK